MRRNLLLYRLLAKCSKVGAWVIGGSDLATIVHLDRLLLIVLGRLRWKVLGRLLVESSGQVAAESSGQDPNWPAEVLPAFCLAVVRPATGFSLLPLPPLLLLLPAIFLGLAPDFVQPRDSLGLLLCLGHFAEELLFVSLTHFVDY